MEQLSGGKIPIDLLVNNAGFGLRGEFCGLSIRRQLEMLRLQQPGHRRAHLQPPAENVRATAKGHHQHLLDCRLSAHSFASVYSATKAFLTGVFSGPGAGAAQRRVAVVTVCPGRLGKNGNDESELCARAKWAGIYQSPDEVAEDALQVLANGGGLTVPGLSISLAFSHSV